MPVGTFKKRLFPMLRFGIPSDWSILTGLFEHLNENFFILLM